MSQDHISGEFQFNVTGSGLKDLASLNRELQRTNERMLAVVRTATTLDKAIRDSATAAKNRTKDWTNYAAAVNKASAAQDAVAKASTAKTSSSGVPTLGNTGIANATSTAQAAQLKTVMALQRQQAKEQAAYAAQTLRDQEKFVSGLANTRYALYDVQRTWMLVGAASAAALVVPLAKMMQFEAQFASVARTVGLVGSEVGEMREEFARLTTEIPESFAALSSIGTLAGQLDIPEAAIAGFTDTVAKFSATTDVAVEEAATNLGRTAQLTGTSASEYQNLAAAIYQTGVTSVATEGEILKMTTEIATAGDLAGLTNVQIVALASALASLGVQPERARGSLQRIFNIIENGATVGTKATEGLSRITGYTFEQMQALWKQGDQGSQQVFTAFISGLSQLQRAGQNTDTVLKNLGISAVRDIQTLQVLANNTDVYNRSLQETSQAYADGEALNKGYAQQTDNLQGNLSRLSNTLTAILAELGESGGWLNTVVKAANEIAKGLLTIAQSPVGKFLGGLVGTLAALTAAFALNRAISAGATAAMYGMVTAAQGVAASGIKTTASVGSLSKQLLQTAVAFSSGTLTATRFNQILGVTSVQAAASSTALQRMASGFQTAKLGAMGLATSLKGVAVSSGVLLAVSAAIWAVSAAWEHFTETAQDRADARFGEGVLGLTEALRADKTAIDEGAKAIRTYTNEIDVAAGSSVPEWRSELDQASGAQRDLTPAVEGTTAGVRDQTLAIGENTTAWLAQSAANNEAMQKMWQEFGGDLGMPALTGWFDHLKSDADSGVAYVQQKMRGMNDDIVRLQNERQVAQMQGDTAAAASMTRQIEALARQKMGWEELLRQSEAANVKIGEASVQADIYKAAGLGAAQATDDLADSFDDGATAADTFSKTLSDLNTNLQAPGDVADSWRDLGKSIAENGNVFAGLSEAAGENIDSLIGLVNNLQKQAGGDLEAFGLDIIGVMGALQNSGVQSSEVMEYLGSILNETLGPTYNLNFNTGPFRQNIINAINLAIRARQELLATQAAAMNAAITSYSGNPMGQAAAYQRAQQDYQNTQAEITKLEGLREQAMKSSSSAQNNLTSATNGGTKALNKNSGAAKKNASETKKAARSYRDWADDLREVMKIADEYRFGVEDAWADVEKAQADAEKALIQSIYNIGDAYDYLFLEQEHRDAIQSLFLDMQEQAEDAAKAVRDAAQKIADAEAELQGLSADRSQLEYGLMVAETYGNELRAISIRAKLADVDAKSTKTRNDLTDAQEDYQKALESQSKSLTGNTRQSIENRDTIAELVSQYDDYIQRLIESGASQNVVTKAVADSKTSFLNEASSMGFATSQLLPYLAAFDRIPASSSAARDAQWQARDAVRGLYDAWQNYVTALAASGAPMETIRTAINNGKTSVTNIAGELAKGPQQVRDYVAAFDGMRTIVDKVPKNVNVAVNVNKDPAERALEEFTAKLNSTRASADKLYTSLDKLGNSSASPKVTIKMPSDSTIEKAYALAMVNVYTKRVNDAAASGSKNLGSYIEDLKYWKGQYKKYYTGGFTGRGGKYEEAGIVHKGEYVIPKEQVNQATGTPYIMERAVPQTTSGSSSRAPSTLVVELSPTDRALLAANGNVTVTLDGKVIANSTNAINASNFRRGSN